MIHLTEYECTECDATLLLERERNPENCPYCHGDIDYSAGRIEVIATHTPRKDRQA